ncbi:MAG: 3'(2'),5'-bisphosphate nucleotidase CysQ [Planctomycetota bacterium]|jgi:3'(2'), 5'-bisphosphate nucleotidase
MDEKILKQLLDATEKNELDVNIKEDGSPLTRADTASHTTIEAGLKELEPLLPIISEEGDLENATKVNLEVFWLIDPLDGTKEFVKGLDEYTVNIALIENSVPILGVIYVPVSETLYYAAKGVGAWKIDKDKSAVEIHTSDGDKMQTAVVSRSHLSEQTEEFLSKIGVSDIIQHGSSLKMCSVAEGAADIYPRFGPTCLWDTGAGTAIATEAGCDVVDLEGNKLSYNLADGLKQYGFMVYPKKHGEFLWQVI